MPSAADLPTDIPLLIDNDADDAVDWDTLPPLYIMYTSGSTGTPKGVLGTHKGLVNRLRWQYATFPYRGPDPFSHGDDDDDEDDDEEDKEDKEDEDKEEDEEDEEAGRAPVGEVAMRRTPLTFVDAVAEIFAPLLAGVPLWAPPAGTVRSGGLAAVAVAAAAAGVTRVTVLPSQLALTLRMCPDVGVHWPSLTFVHVSGEACPSGANWPAWKCVHRPYIGSYPGTPIPPPPPPDVPVRYHHHPCLSTVTPVYGCDLWRPRTSDLVP